MTEQTIKCALVSQHNDVVAYVRTTPAALIQYEGKTYKLTDERTLGGWFIYMELNDD